MKKPWYFDSGCSRHMTDDESLFQELDRNRSGSVTFGDNSKRAIQGIGTIGNNSQTQIKHVLYAESLKHNLLNISQLCDKGFIVCFNAHACHVIDSNTNKVIYIEKRHDNVYVIYIDEIDIHNESCLCVNDVNDNWLLSCLESKVKHVIIVVCP